MRFGTLGHYVANLQNGANNAVIVWLTEKDPDGMSAAEIDAQLSRLSELSVEVSKAHTKSDDDKAAYDAAVAQNATRLRTAEIAQGKVDKETDPAKKDSMQKELSDYLASVEADQTQLDSLKQVYESAKAFYEYLQRLFDEKGNNLRTMKAQLTIAGNSMKTAKLREQQADERAQVVKDVVGGSGHTDKFNVALAAMKKSATVSNEHAEAAERLMTKLTEDPNKGSSFMAQAMSEASGEDSPPKATADRIQALKAKAA